VAKIPPHFFDSSSRRSGGIDGRPIFASQPVELTADCVEHLINEDANRAEWKPHRDALLCDK
jgi:hypothetical protein